MSGVNFLNDYAGDDIYSSTASGIGGNPYDASSLDAVGGPGVDDSDARLTSASLAIMLLLAVGLVVLLDRGGFRGLIAA